MALPYTVKVLEHCRVSPPLNSVPPASLPLTFFDIAWLSLPPVQCIFLYEYPHPIINTILPSLKHSLSLTLQHFFPFAATLVRPPYPAKPHILNTDTDSVSLTIAESPIDFTHLSSNYPRDGREFHSLVPQLSWACVSSTDTHEEVEVIPALALQVTIFPNIGICIGITSVHAVADGMTTSHFMKSWASIFRSKGDLSCIHKSLPFYDRSVIKDSKGLDTILLNQLSKIRSSETTNTSTTPLEQKFRETFVMGRCHIERLKQWVLTQCSNEGQQLHVSTFVVTCAFIWVCLIKSQVSVMINNNNNESLDDDELCHFIFAADCRNHREIDAPMTYFGNCVVNCFASTKRRELVGENGVVVAVKAIGSKIKELESGVLKGVENWNSTFEELRESRHLISVAGSNRMRLYDIDFGWGRPKKIEIVHIDGSEIAAISLAECRDEEGGIEVGLALNGVEMDAFNSISEQGREKFCLY